MSHFQLFDRASKHENRIAVISAGQRYTYLDLQRASDEVFSALSNHVSTGDRVAFLVDPSFEFVATQWGIWKAGCIAVPLCTHHPPPALRFSLSDAGVTLAVVQKEYADVLCLIGEDLNLDILEYQNLADANPARSTSSPALELDAMMLYTSGTTNLPKGVVTSFANIQAQIMTLVEAWEWQKDDHILNVLPLHHVHGIINVVSCALWTGACVQFVKRFDAERVFATFLLGEVNLFMAVPTIYHKLISHWRKQDEDIRLELSACLEKFRLMVSGSAALPVPVLQEWKDISGQVLLERYGMTEIGMALSNPYDGERRPGHVGHPLPGVNVRLVDDRDVIEEEGRPGEIQIKSPSVFKMYWNRREATDDAFTEDGWFRTGDIALLDAGYYRILGRSSVDIIKSGGYKISALEIESNLLQHPCVLECAVVGLDDVEWGQIVAAAIVGTARKSTPEELKSWLQQRLASYQVPRHYIFVDKIPKNTIGKVTKKEVALVIAEALT